MPDVPHHIWHHRGHPRPTAKTGSNHEWTLEYLMSRPMMRPQTPTKKIAISTTTAQRGTLTRLHRNCQLRPYGPESQ